MYCIKSHNTIEDNFKRTTWRGATLLAVFSILAQYKLPIMSYGLILLTIYGMGVLIQKGRIVFNKGILYFTLGCVVSQFVLYLYSGTFEKNMNTFFFMFVALFLLSSLYDIEKRCFIQVYYVIGIICSILVIYQFVMGNVFGVPQSAISILPISDEDMHFWIRDSIRASGVFTEPQAYCSYIIPLLISLLFRKKIISAIFISVALIASTSSQGIILGIIVWSYFIVFSKGNSRKKFFGFLSIVFAIIFAFFVMWSNPIFQPIIDKMLAIEILGYDIRLTKGFMIYYEMPIMDKVTGIGFGNLSNYLLNGHFDFIWIILTRDELLGYITTMSSVLVNFGIIPFFLYVNIFRENWKSGTPEAKLVLIVIFISSFTQTILFNAWFVFYWIVYEVYDNIDSNRYLNVRL